MTMSDRDQQRWCVRSRPTDGTLSIKEIERLADELLRIPLNEIEQQSMQALEESVRRSVLVGQLRDKPPESPKE